MPQEEDHGPLYTLTVRVFVERRTDIKVDRVPEFEAFLALGFVRCCTANPGKTGCKGTPGQSYLKHPTPR